MIQTTKKIAKLLRENKAESPISYDTASWIFTMRQQEYELIYDKVIEKVIINGEIWYNIL